MPDRPPTSGRQAAGLDNSQTWAPAPPTKKSASTVSRKQPSSPRQPQKQQQKRSPKSKQSQRQDPKRDKSKPSEPAKRRPGDATKSSTKTQSDSSTSSRPVEPETSRYGGSPREAVQLRSKSRSHSRPAEPQDLRGNSSATRTPSDPEYIDDEADLYPDECAITDDEYIEDAFQEPPDDGVITAEIQQELQEKWILNLSMAFRDKNYREKFFVTYAETPNFWRRVTVWIFYENAQPGTLEFALLQLRFPRDKSAHIYESLRNTIHTVEFYPTVTNLRLETVEGRLHLHVSEDVNETIKYPPLSAVGHLERKFFDVVHQSDVDFIQHMSGFVYKVGVGQQKYIKKEIPGPDMVDEFLYEINALYALRDINEIVNLKGIIVNEIDEDDPQQRITGLLVELAEQGTLVDRLFESKEQPIDMALREKWAMQIVHGVAAIHGAGFVQGDLTLSNIVIDAYGDAKIIDINRRGCPMGWEAPEFMGLIESKQHISMYIGSKSDCFQLGMVLYALAKSTDEPEREEKLIEHVDALYEAPDWLREWISLCLEAEPMKRWTAKELIEKPLPKYGRIVEYPSSMWGTQAPRNTEDTRKEEARGRTRNASHSISGLDVQKEPESFDDAPFERLYPARRTGADSSARRKLMQDYPMHQDSGLELDEQGAQFARTHFSAPAHQDSGLPDLDFIDSNIAPEGDDCMDGVEPSSRGPRSASQKGASDFIGIGAGAVHAGRR